MPVYPRLHLLLLLLLTTFGLLECIKKRNYFRSFDHSLLFSNETNANYSGVPVQLTSIINGSETTAHNASCVTLAALTWNLAEKALNSKSIGSLKDVCNMNNDIVVIGIQELEDIKPRRKEGHRSRLYKMYLKKVFHGKYECLGTRHLLHYGCRRPHHLLSHSQIGQHKMGGMFLSVFIKHKLAKKVSGIQIIDVACGVGNLLTNKGGICLLLRMNKKTLAIINAHFAAHQDKIVERNNDYHRVMSTITSRAHSKWIVKGHPARKKLKNNDIIDNALLFNNKVHHPLHHPLLTSPPINSLVCSG